jgi:AraC-like DNA-binding protein
MSAAASTTAALSAAPPRQRTPTPSSEDELLALVEARALVEGRTESPYPGLSFYRMQGTTTCRKSGFQGATLLAVLRGRKTLRFGGETLDADPSRHVVVTRETGFESATFPAHDGPFLALSLTFSAEIIVKALVALSELGASTAVETVPAFVSSFDACNVDTLVRLMRTLDDPVDLRLIAPLIVEECAVRLLRCNAAAAMRSALLADGDALKIETAMKYIRANASRALSVQQIARQVGMSTSHFAHRFRDVARTSPMRYLRQVRLGEARTLMISEGVRPSEVAARVGFESPSHFSREFKRHFGAAPAEYVRKFRP